MPNTLRFIVVAAVVAIIASDTSLTGATRNPQIQQTNNKIQRSADPYFMHEGVHAIENLQRKINRGVTERFGKGNVNIQAIIKSLDKAKVDVANAGRSLDVEQLKMATSSVSKAIPQLLHKDPIEKARGVLNGISAVSLIFKTVAGPIGLVIGAITSVTSTILGIAHRSREDPAADIGHIMESIVENLLHKRAHKELITKIESARRKFERSQVVLTTFSVADNVTDKELGQLERIDILTADVFVEIERFVNDEDIKYERSQQIKHVHQLLRAYSMLRALHLGMMTSLYTLYGRHGWSTAATGIKHLIEAELQASRNFLDFLVRPSDRYARIAVNFWSERENDTAKFLSVIKLDMTSEADELDGECVEFRTRNPAGYLWSRDTGSHRVTGEKLHIIRYTWGGVDNNRNTVYRIKKAGEYFRVLQNVDKNENEYTWLVFPKTKEVALVNAAAYGKDEPPNKSQALFKIVKTDTNKYYISVQRHPLLVLVEKKRARGQDQYALTAAESAKRDGLVAAWWYLMEVPCSRGGTI